ncbi:hypothetical protein [Pseudogulbenkiania sp. MAI-1]|uniref:hypothetical protein n=1 Tax=Pseudogulbenkiania sp. MAI-1 TaxID=990370 RepID=UPI0004B4D69C|nr:hypothetical protein [Pseudogulbenkiania sp. MAI-1]
MQAMTDVMAMMKPMHAGADCPAKGKAKSGKPSSRDDRMKMMDMMMQKMHQQTSMMSRPMGPMGGDAKE